MLRAARSARNLLGDSSERVADFLRSRLHADGGFIGRWGAADLYYTVFGMEGLLALGAELPAGPLAAYLRAFGCGESLDLVHLCCLGRCWAGLPAPGLSRGDRRAILDRIRAFRCRDGGYSHVESPLHGTAYGCFLALCAAQDLEADWDDLPAMAGCLQDLRAGDGGYANAPGLPVGSTPATAAAVCVLHHLGAEADPGLGDWLLRRCHAQGGFLATTAAPMSDLLSTATALHALWTMNAPLGRVKESCLDFVDGLWSPRGAFRAHRADDALDCEYTYYGLLALGHLSGCGLRTADRGE